MNNPNYENYTLTELKEALNSIDESTYNTRAQLIRKEIEKKTEEIKGQESREEEQIRKKVEFNKKVQKYLNKVIQKFEAFSWILNIFSFVLGVSLLSSGLFEFSLVFSELRYTADFYILGLFQLEPSTIKYIFILIFYIPISGLIIGPILNFFKKIVSNILLCISWFALTIGVKFIIIQWWPTLSFDIELGFDFVFNIEYEIGFKVNIIAAYFFIWSAFLVPQFRNGIFKELKVDK